ncbi:MAG: alpha-L-fucosidase [Planctomycetota bacterium]
MTCFRIQRQVFPIVLLMALFGLSGSTATAQESIVSGDVAQDFEPTWESLGKHDNQPEWLADAKLGIYFHWGPYSVPAYKNEWYPRFMQLDAPPNWGRGVKEHHAATYGPPSKFGYHDFIPMFTAEAFDAKEWANLFASAGAKFAGPVAQHHDGFSMWDSEVNPNNAMDEGPKRDITGELLSALREQGLKTITTFHHSFTGQRQREGLKKGERAISYYPYGEDLFTSTDDPKLRKLYGNMPDAEFNEYWIGLVEEVVDKYSPDIIWFDSWLDVIPEDYRQRMAAYHFNAGQSKGQKVVLACKQQDMPDNTRILDIEQGGMKDLSDQVWMTDITLSYAGWCYVQDHKYKPTELLIRNMIDVWSKRGVVLLNISPRADGVIVDEQRDRLAGLGKWLEVYGEAVYGTVPHSLFGYGDASIKDGSHGGQSATIKYSAGDIRFTRSKDGRFVYVFMLGQPKAGSELLIKHVADVGKIGSVEQLGTDELCRWSVGDGGLLIEAPAETSANEIATVFKVGFAEPLR